MVNPLDVWAAPGNPCRVFSDLLLYFLRGESDPPGDWLYGAASPLPASRAGEADLRRADRAFIARGRALGFPQFAVFPTGPGN